MKILGLLRHAKSDWNDRDIRDFDRGLNDRGRRGAALIGAHIREYGIKWHALAASPAERVKQTIAAAKLGIAANWDDRLYLAPTDTIFAVLQEAEGDAILLAGHNPGLADMVLELVPPAKENALFDEAKVKFPTATFAVFELAIDNWADLQPGCGTLVHLARPRDLDPRLGPQN